jgi:hypothetical protein
MRSSRRCWTPWHLRGGMVDVAMVLVQNGGQASLSAAGHAIVTPQPINNRIVRSLWLRGCRSHSPLPLQLVLVLRETCTPLHCTRPCLAPCTPRHPPPGASYPLAACRLSLSPGPPQPACAASAVAAAAPGVHRQAGHRGAPCRRSGRQRGERRRGACAPPVRARRRARSRQRASPRCQTPHRRPPGRPSSSRSRQRREPSLSRYCCSGNVQCTGVR